MVKATCESCGATHQFDDAEVPPSGKVVTCTCGAPLTVMHAGAAEMGFTVSPKATTAGLGSPLEPGKPARKPFLGGPAVAEFNEDNDSAAALGLDDISFVGGGTDLAEVAAPSRQSPLTGAETPGQARKSRSALADALASADQAPVQRSAISNLPKKPQGFLDSPGKGPGISDLPAPKRPAGISDLPAPKRPAGISDLPAPKRPAGISDLPAPKKPQGFLDLPAPGSGPVIKPPMATSMGLGANKDPGVGNLPAPVGPTPTKNTNLPTPVGPTPTKNTDLLTPVGPTSSKLIDLPTPVGPTPTKNDLLTPVGPTPSKSTDLLTPVGPTPSKSTDLPAPKGFFDDLPAPAANKPAAAAPKGFFDDIEPAPAGAPKGFFDDMPAAPSKPQVTEQLGSPEPASVGSLDLDDLDLAPPSAEPSPPAEPDFIPPLDLGDALDLGEPLDLGKPKPAVMALELPDDSADAGGDRFGELDLPSTESSPPAAGGVVSFSSPASPAPPPKRSTSFSGPADEGGLELDSDAAADARHQNTGTTVAEADGLLDADTLGDAPAGKKRKTKKKKPAKKKEKRKLTRKQVLVLIAVVVVVAIAGGGFWLYKKKLAADEHDQLVKSHLKNSRRSMQSDKPLHWEDAAQAAKKALALDKKSGDALGLAAQAEYAAIIDEAIGLDRRSAAGRALIRRINDASVQSVEAEKAEALREMIEGQPAEAVKALTKLQKNNARDADLALYLGWAHAAVHNHKKATTAFTAALKLAPNRIPAQYGLARAELALGNIEKARDAFKKTFDRDKQYKDQKGHIDHLGALVGYYQVKKVARFSERESLFLEITRHKDADKADPRAMSLAWSLAGDQALRAGRVDEAKQRFDRALELSKTNLNAKVGQALTDVAQGRLDDARRRLTEVLEIDAHHLEASLAVAEVATLQHKDEEAQKHVDIILKRDPPLDNPADLARAHLVQGAIYERDPSNLASAIAEYEKALALVGPEDDVRPTLALASALAHHTDSAERERGITLLGPLESKAATDPALAVTLGLAWLNAGKADKAEKWFRAALDRKPNDVETLFQLGLALYAQKRFDDAIASIVQAYELDEGREDVGLRLAVIYEELKRDDEAGAIYAKLLTVKEPSLNVHSRAGRFYARLQQYDKVRTHADAILAAKPKEPAGLFLRGEALASAGRFEDSVRFYRDAVAVMAEPQYLDGLGRALENVTALDDALRAFKQAATQVPDYLSPRLGIARIRMARREFLKGIEALEDARRLAPKNAWIFFQLGECYRETNRVRKSVDYYRKSISFDDTEQLVFYKLGRAYFDLDKTSEAAAAFTRATQLFERKRKAVEKSEPDYDEPWVTEGYRKLGFAERARGNKSAAIRAFEAYLQRNPNDRAEISDVKRLLMRLKAH